MAGIGFITLENNGEGTYPLSIDEKVCAMLFDCGSDDKVWQDFNRLASNFKGGAVKKIYNLSDAEELGIRENSFMNGIPYYHIRSFYEHVNDNAELYVCIADCTSNGEPDFSIIEDIQFACGGRIFQLGIWTEKEIWRYDNGEYTFTKLLGNVGTEAGKLSGTVNLPTSCATPINVVLCANTRKVENSEDEINYRNIPYALGQELPKLSVLLGQDGSDEVHAMQLSSPTLAPVGYLGVFMACLCLAPAEENIAYVENHDINKNDNFRSPELGFGDVRNDYWTPLEDIISIRREELAAKGYIIPITYAAKEAGVYWSNDQTLSKGTFKSLSVNRVAHKIRRIIRRAMVPHINETVYVDPKTGRITPSFAASIQNEIISDINFYMKNNQGLQQINGAVIMVDTFKGNELLNNDSLHINCVAVLADNSSKITVQEECMI